jgi:hypothetical protein
MTPKELKNMAPKLFEIKNLKNSFCVPKKYFDAIEVNIKSSIFSDSLENESTFKTPKNYFDALESSVLEKIKREDKSVPENYFETLEDKIFEKINTKNKVISINQRFLKKFAPFAVAASIVLVFTLQYFNNTEVNKYAAVNGDNIELWLNNEELNFNDIELAYLYEDTEIGGIRVFDIYKEEEVFDYLNDLNVESLILTN